MRNLVDDELTCFEETLKKKDWMQSMIEEYQSIIKNDVWDVVPRPKDKSVVPSKWFFKTNHSVDGSIENFKAIFVT